MYQRSPQLNKKRQDSKEDINSILLARSQDLQKSNDYLQAELQALRAENRSLKQSLIQSSFLKQ